MKPNAVSDSVIATVALNAIAQKHINEAYNLILNYLRYGYGKEFPQPLYEAHVLLNMMLSPLISRELYQKLLDETIQHLNTL
jgi:hypothetical protein